MYINKIYRDLYNSIIMNIFIHTLTLERRKKKKIENSHINSFAVEKRNKIKN